MGTTFRYIEDPNDKSDVLSWFQSLKQPPEVVASPRAQVLYFRELGPLTFKEGGEIDSGKSPVATVFLPKVVAGGLWSVGEVHFLATPLKEKYPELHKISSSFSKWLRQFECVFSNKPGSENPWNYYLEGSVRNYDPPIFALPSGLSSLKKGRYFIAENESESQVERLCQALVLRGVELST